MHEKRLTQRDVIALLEAIRLEDTSTAPSSQRIFNRGHRKGPAGRIISDLAERQHISHQSSRAYETKRSRSENSVCKSVLPHDLHGSLCAMDTRYTD
jgi:hypothetical protein